MKTVLETLTAARKLVTPKIEWLQGGSGRSYYPARRCSGAAICDAGAPWPSYPEIWAALESEMGGDIPHFNDSHTHAEVLAAFDAAIEKAKVQNA